LYLPTMQPSFDVCWIDLPQRSLGDAQVSAEYVALGILSLAKKSTTGKVSIIGDSQGGGLHPQWALLWFPSIRPFVSAYIALAPDFHGTLITAACPAQTILLGGCQQSYWQQWAYSNYIRAQNIEGYKELVPTTSIYTLSDELVIPDSGPFFSSRLENAAVIALQDPDICGPLKVTDHFLFILDPAVFGLAYNALLHGGHADSKSFDKRYCVGFIQGGNLIESAHYLQSLVDDVGAGLGQTATLSRAEPPLKPYVCERYPDQGFTCA